ncbi:MAG: 23S rRNA (uracil(1939)-C(5))-methyltransferase RlmD [bacterium]
MAKEKYKTVPVAKGDEAEITVENPLYGGGGVGRIQGFSVFVRGAAPGSRVICVIEDVKKNYAAARIKNIIKRSPDYIPPECPYFGGCGGCQWLDMKYEAQLKHKAGFVRTNIEKQREAAAPRIAEIKGAEKNKYYRNRAQYKLSDNDGVLKMGFYRERSHEVIDVNECRIVGEKINETARTIKEMLKTTLREKMSVYDEKTHTGSLRHICIRINKENNVLVTFVAADAGAKKVLERAASELMEKIQGLKSVVLNINPDKGNRVFGAREIILAGEGYLKEQVNGIKFKLAGDTFFQVNREMLKEMLDFIGKNLHQGAKLLDFYGGIGALSLPFHKTADSILIAEINPRSIEILNKITEENSIKNARCISGDAAKNAGKIIADEDPDIIIFDPPRKGIHKEVIEEVKKSGVEKIIYISCDPVTFARDLKEFGEKYEIKEIQPLDLFPHTYHTETMCFMEAKHK